MIKIENCEVSGFKAAIRGMRNPMNSWDKSDSGIGCAEEGCLCRDCPYVHNRFPGDCAGHFIIGKNDFELMKKLVNAGSDHRKFMRFITVTVDVTAPLYWWKEYDTYKVGTVANSCSTMHKIHAKEFTLDDFSHEHLFRYKDNYERHIIADGNDELLIRIINALNLYREMYIRYKDKDYWWQMIQLLPTSYNQKRTLLLNYEVLRNIYHARKNHKLDEWHGFCEWIESLPYSELITM